MKKRKKRKKRKKKIRYIRGMISNRKGVRIWLNLEIM